MGEPLTERTVRGPMPVTIGDISYGPDIFSKWPLADLAALGIKLFIEEGIPAHYSGGVPVDVQEGNTIRRTYPNPVLQAESWRQQLAASAQLKKTAKYTNGILVNGVLFDSDDTAYGAYMGHQIMLMVEGPDYVVPDWKASDGVWVDMTAALFAQVMAVYMSTKSGAFTWLKGINEALAEAPDTYAALKAIEDQINAE
jgi:hypothetical protein